MRENKGKCDKRRLKIAKFFRTELKSEREGGRENKSKREREKEKRDGESRKGEILQKACKRVKDPSKDENREGRG